MGSERLTAPRANPNPNACDEKIGAYSDPCDEKDRHRASRDQIAPTTIHQSLVFPVRVQGQAIADPAPDYSAHVASGCVRQFLDGPGRRVDIVLRCSIFFVLGGSSPAMELGASLISIFGLAIFDWGG
jgi:hypothetical protein